jgi:hypothetical protein
MHDVSYAFGFRDRPEAVSRGVVGLVAGSNEIKADTLGKYWLIGAKVRKRAEKRTEKRFCTRQESADITEVLRACWTMEPRESSSAGIQSGKIARVTPNRDGSHAVFV